MSAATILADKLRFEIESAGAGYFSEGQCLTLMQAAADQLRAMEETAIKRNRIIRKLRRRCERRLKIRGTL